MSIGVSLEGIFEQKTLDSAKLIRGEMRLKGKTQADHTYMLESCLIDRLRDGNRGGEQS